MFLSLRSPATCLPIFPLLTLISKDVYPLLNAPVPIHQYVPSAAPISTKHSSIDNTTTTLPIMLPTDCICSSCCCFISLFSHRLTTVQMLCSYSVSHGLLASRIINWWNCTAMFWHYYLVSFPEYLEQVSLFHGLHICAYATE